MTSANVTTIGDRIYAINQTISGATAERYFPENLDTWKIPLLTHEPRRASRQRYTETHQRITRQFTLIAIAGYYTEGLPTQTALANAESLLEDVEEVYDQRDRLQLAGNDDVLDYLISAQLGDDTGVIERGGLAIIEFPLIVVYDRIVTLL